MVDVPKELLALGLKASGNKDAQNWVDKIDHLRVLSLEEATKATKEEFQKAVEAFNWKGYDEMVKVNSEGSKVRIMTQGTDEVIKRISYLRRRRGRMRLCGDRWQHRTERH